MLVAVTSRRPAKAIPRSKPGSRPCCSLTRPIAAFSNDPPRASPRAPTPPSPKVQAAQIGPYTLVEAIGEGGFGKVFVAEQRYPVPRKVALKIIKPGMDTHHVVARFESERRALALMAHPNIAHLIDGGATASGRPYFVMELVRGETITDFCDQNHYSAAERLKLFISVCQAIQHAHHKGVIHRDIKPSNVMVTVNDGTPVVKIIDFGVAKAIGVRLTENSLFTVDGQMVGTPAYMSPEQASMSRLDVDTRSDVYSLGVLLYELLTGTTPIETTRLRDAGFSEIGRLIREVEPPRPSTRLSALGESATLVAGNRATDPRRLFRLLSGDLDWIVMKALEKDPNRRYASPGSFADDVERYLRGEAILARPPSTAYRIAKFAARHRVAVVAALAVAVSLLGGTALATWQAMRAREAERSGDSGAGRRGRAAPAGETVGGAGQRRPQVLPGQGALGRPAEGPGGRAAAATRRSARRSTAPSPRSPRRSPASPLWRRRYETPSA